MSIKDAHGASPGTSLTRLWCARREQFGGFDRKLPRSERKLHKVVCVPHICCLSASPCLTRWIRFPPLPYLVVFCLARSPSFCLAVILALAICFTVRHTQSRRKVGRETVLKKGMSGKGKEESCTVRASADISKLSRVLFWGCFHWNITGWRAVQRWANLLLILDKVKRRFDILEIFAFCFIAS